MHALRRRLSTAAIPRPNKTPRAWWNTPQYDRHDGRPGSHQREHDQNLMHNSTRNTSEQRQRPRTRGPTQSNQPRGRPGNQADSGRRWWQLAKHPLPTDGVCSQLASCVTPHGRTARREAPRAQRSTTAPKGGVPQQAAPLLLPTHFGWRWSSRPACPSDATRLPVPGDGARLPQACRYRQSTHGPRRPSAAGGPTPGA